MSTQKFVDFRTFAYTRHLMTSCKERENEAKWLWRRDVIVAWYIGLIFTFNGKVFTFIFSCIQRQHRTCKQISFSSHFRQKMSYLCPLPEKEVEAWHLKIEKTNKNTGNCFFSPHHSIICFSKPNSCKGCVC